MAERIPQPTVRSVVSPERRGDIERWCADVAALIDRYPAEAVIEVTAEIGDVRTFTITVKDRRLKETVGPWVVHLWITDDLTGLVPGGTQAVTFGTGTVLETYDPNVRWSVLTDADGVIEMDVEVTGAGSRRVVAKVEPALNASASAAWV